MKYDINLLGEKYAEFLESQEIVITSPQQTKFNTQAYNDYEYIETIKAIQNDFEDVDDLAMYEKFLKGE